MSQKKCITLHSIITRKHNRCYDVDMLFHDRYEWIQVHHVTYNAMYIYYSHPHTDKCILDISSSSLCYVLYATICQDYLHKHNGLFLNGVKV